MGFALDRLTDPNTFTLLCGGSIMLIGAGIGIAATYRLRVNPSDEYGDDTETVDGLFGLGERCIGLVRRHPVVSCTTIAALSIFPAMSHAETTLPGALPWGLIQAATVVLGFVVLGPTLRLRSSDEMTDLGPNTHAEVTVPTVCATRHTACRATSAIPPTRSTPFTELTAPFRLREVARLEHAGRGDEQGGSDRGEEKAGPQH